MNEPVPIAFCITDLDVGGAERALLRIVTGLDRTEWSPAVYCLSQPGPLAKVLLDAGVPVTCLGLRRFWEVHKIRRLSLVLRQQQPMILQTFLFHANFVGRLAGWWAGVPHIVSGIRVSERRYASYLWLDAWTQCLVKRHVCVSQEVADFSIQQGRLNARKIRVIPNGVDAASYREAIPADLSTVGVKPEAFVWLTVGRLEEQKGPWVWLEAVSQLAIQFPQAHWLWAGQGPLAEKLQRDTQKRGLKERVSWLGFREDVPNLLRSVQGFVLSSLWEGQPNAVLEAMAAGLPVVTTAVEGVSTMIDPGKTGLLVTPGNAQDLATAMADVMTRPDLARQMSSAGQKHVVENFSWENVIRQYETLYRDLLENEPA